MDKKQIINQMIEKGLFSEGYKDFLNGLSECQLGTLRAHEENKPEPEPVEPNLNELLEDVGEDADEALLAAHNAYMTVVNGDNAVPETLEEFVESAPDKFKDILNSLVQERNERKESLVKGLVENDRCEFTKEQLESKEISELEALSKLANVKVSYEANANDGPAEEDEDENSVPLPPRINWGGEEQ